jgi:hypothetical protein
METRKRKESDPLRRAVFRPHRSELQEHLARHKALREAGRPPGERPDWLRSDPPGTGAALVPFGAYLATGRKPPRGSPRETRWATDIKTRLWPGIPRAVRALYVDNFPVLHLPLLALARVGYPPEAAALFRAAYVAWVLDLIDEKDAKFWIELVTDPGPDLYPPMRNVSYPLSRPEKAVLYAFLAVLPSPDEFLKRHPTPDDWHAELRRRGLRCDEPVTEADWERVEEHRPKAL